MRLSIILLLLAICSPTTYAQLRSSNILISPGIKIGSSSGAEGGFTLGCELSVTYLTDAGFYYGAVIDYDGSARGRKKIHIGAEGGTAFIGMEIGPTLVLGEGDPRLGWTATPYIGLLLYPYYSVTMLSDTTFDEGGVYVKFPYRADGSRLFSMH